MGRVGSNLCLVSEKMQTWGERTNRREPKPRSRRIAYQIRPPVACMKVHKIGHYSRTPQAGSTFFKKTGAAVAGYLITVGVAMFTVLLTNQLGQFGASSQQ